jgi:hypothetical protein
VQKKSEEGGGVSVQRRLDVMVMVLRAFKRMPATAGKGALQ